MLLLCEHTMISLTSWTTQQTRYSISVTNVPERSKKKKKKFQAISLKFTESVMLQKFFLKLKSVRNAHLSNKDKKIIQTTQLKENTALTMCFYVCPMCVLDKCEICPKICNSAATLQAHNEKFHIMKNSTNQIFYKCDLCTKTF